MSYPTYIELIRFTCFLHNMKVFFFFPNFWKYVFCVITYFTFYLLLIISRFHQNSKDSLNICHFPNIIPICMYTYEKTLFISFYKKKYYIHILPKNVNEVLLLSFPSFFYCFIFEFKSKCSTVT